MTKINLKNDKTKTATTVLGALMIVLILTSPSVAFPNVGAVTSQPMPHEVTEWLASHPHFFGCIQTDLKKNVTTEATCLNPELRPMSFSWGPQKLDCSTHCFAGGEFDLDAAYNEITANSVVGSVPSQAQTGYQLGYWAGLTNCSGAGSSSTSSCPTASLLVQSGWAYTSAKTAEAFAEIWGNFSYGGVNCKTNFCGMTTTSAASDSIYTANYADTGNSEWVAYVQDNTKSTSKSFMVPFSTAGVSNSLPYPVVSLEAYDAPTTSYLPSSPISFTGITVYAPGSGQVNADTGHMLSYYGPTVSSGGITFSFSATGTTTATATNSWS